MILVGCAHLQSALALVIVAEPETRLDLTAQAAQRGGSDDAFGCAADTHDRVDARARDGTRDGGRKVAVGDQLDARAGLPYLGDELLVARPVEDDDGDVVDASTEGRRDPREIFGRG